MKNLLGARNSLLALLVFFPITPSIAALTVFTKSILIERNHNVSFVPKHNQITFKS